MKLRYAKHSPCGGRARHRTTPDCGRLHLLLDKFRIRACRHSRESFGYILKARANMPTADKSGHAHFRIGLVVWSLVDDAPFETARKPAQKYGHQRWVSRHGPPDPECELDEARSGQQAIPDQCVDGIEFSDICDFDFRPHALPVHQFGGSTQVGQTVVVDAVADIERAAGERGHLSAAAVNKRESCFVIGLSPVVAGREVDYGVTVLVSYLPLYRLMAVWAAGRVSVVVTSVDMKDGSARAPALHRAGNDFCRGCWLIWASVLGGGPRPLLQLI